MRLYVSGHRPGALPEAGESATGERPCWWETPYGQWRLSVEQEAMGRFPGFSSHTAGGHLHWVGELKSSLNPENRYLVRVSYPNEFPDLPPEVTIQRPELPQGVPHLLDRKRPCLFRATEGPRNGYDPGRTTAATIVAWTALWIHAFETWRATGNWPGKGD